jgi:hypothetical protein
MRVTAALCLALSIIAHPALGQTGERPGASRKALSPDPNASRPIAAHNSVWIEQLTWMEVRDAIRSGKTTVIVPTGGVEQNGPYPVTGKHNVNAVSGP